MNVVKVVVLFLFCSLVFCGESSVVELNSENFDYYINNNDHVLVEFYAPWCGHCKKLAPEYERLASEYNATNVVIAKIDSTKNGELTNSQNITGYPTLILYTKGNKYVYSGGRNVASISNWLKKHTTNRSFRLTLPERLEDELFIYDGLSYVIYFASSESDPELQIFRSISENPEFQYFIFGYYVDEEAAQKMGHQVGNVVVLFKNGDSHVIDTLEYSTLERLSERILQVAYPTLETLVMSEEFFVRISNKRSPLVIFFHRNDSLHMSWFKGIAHRLSSQATFAESHVDTYPKLAANWGASGNVIPTAFILLWNDSAPILRVWNENLEFTSEAVESWISDCLNGRECPTWKKSQPVPERQLGPVMVVVGKTFEELVINSDVNVLIEFYAPWCGHCKKLEPIYESLASDLQPYRDRIMVAKIDASENTVDLNISGYPTIVLYKAGAKSSGPIYYTGERTRSSFIKFINENLDMDIQLENEHDPGHQNDEL